MILGTVIKCLGGLYTVRLDSEIDGEKHVTVRARGAFRHEKIVLLAGDRVELEKTAEGSFFTARILPRKNSLIRPPLANLDYIFVVVSSKKPTPSLFIVDKMISIAEHNKIKPVIVISKSDLDSARSPPRGAKDLCFSLQSFPRGFPTRLSHRAVPRAHVVGVDPRLERQGSAGKTGSS